MITTDRIYRSFELAQVQGEEMIITGKAITFNDPTVLYKTAEGIEYKEIIDARALDNTDLSDIVLNIDHAGRVYARTRNNTLKLEKRQDGLYIQADLSKSSEGEKLYKDIKNGLYSSMSFAFTIEHGGENFNKETKTRTITKIERCFDVSVVTFPAYQNTSVNARDYFKAIAEIEAKKKKLLLLVETV